MEPRRAEFITIKMYALHTFGQIKRIAATGKPSG
jgi:hypothetical protein